MSPKPLLRRQLLFHEHIGQPSRLEIEAKQHQILMLLAPVLSRNKEHVGSPSGGYENGA